MLKWVMLIYSIYNITMSGTVGLPMSTDDATQDIKSILASKVVCIKKVHRSKLWFKNFKKKFQIVDDVMNNYYQDAIRISIRSITDEDFNKIFEANPELTMRKRGPRPEHSKTNNLNNYNFHQCYYNPISCAWKFFIWF